MLISITLWFTPANVRNSINAIAKQWLNRATIEEWLSRYSINKLNTQSPKTIGVIMAGNVPLVGFTIFYAC